MPSNAGMASHLLTLLLVGTILVSATQQQHLKRTLHVEAFVRPKPEDVQDTIEGVLDGVSDGVSSDSDTSESSSGDDYYYGFGSTSSYNYPVGGLAATLSNSRVGGLGATSSSNYLVPGSLMPSTSHLSALGSPGPSTSSSVAPAFPYTTASMSDITAASTRAPEPYSGGATSQPLASSLLVSVLLTMLGVLFGGVCLLAS